MVKRLRTLARVLATPYQMSSGSLATVYNSAEDLVYAMCSDDQTKEISTLAYEGIRPRTDPRLREMIQKFNEFDRIKNNRVNHELDVFHLNLTKDEFKECVGSSKTLIVRALQNQLVIPDWHIFSEQIQEIYQQTKCVNTGKNASYIPQLERVNPDFWGVSVCTVDGQRFSIGDTGEPFCMQSVSKAFNYALALDLCGREHVHRYVGQEPSGHSFNDIVLNRANVPHNPMINAGAIVIASLLKTPEKLSDRFDAIMTHYKKFSGNGHIGFSNQTFLSERECADRNFALGYYMRENNCFPDEAKLNETMDLYFQMCSMETTADTLAAMTATLANGGICPLTNERVVSNKACRDTLSLMHSCGMYDYSGQWAFKVGLPAKSGVSGATAVVIPNEMGIVSFSPRLDPLGNSCKGIAFFQELVQRFNFHNYDSILNIEDQKIDPRKRANEMVGEHVVYILFAAKNGDVNSMKQYVMQGLELDCQDYDGRTAAHVAAAEGHIEVLKFLKEKGEVNPQPKDRWDRTPLDDAKFFNKTEAVEYMQNWMHEFDNNQPLPA